MSERILIIEDNPANLDLMEYLLNSFGYSTLSAKDGAAGLDALRRERPDLVICDIELPVMDGCSVARTVKAEPSLQSIPMIAVTAFAMVGDSEKILSAGFDGYISKPIEPTTFVREVEQFLHSGGRAAIAEAPPAEQSKPEAADANNIRILVVDDSAVNLALHRSLLEPFGYEIITASGIVQGLEAARREHPDLIMSDVNMADGTGFEFIEAVKSEPALRDTPFILITSTVCTQSARNKGLALGATRFLFRPIEPPVLLAEIESCLELRRN
jgi:two-component system cell cycle response regulator